MRGDQGSSRRPRSHPKLATRPYLSPNCDRSLKMRQLLKCLLPALRPHVGRRSDDRASPTPESGNGSARCECGSPHRPANGTVRGDVRAWAIAGRAPRRERGSRRRVGSQHRQITPGSPRNPVPQPKSIGSWRVTNSKSRRAIAILHQAELETFASASGSVASTSSLASATASMLSES